MMINKPIHINWSIIIDADKLKRLHEIIRESVANNSIMNIKYFVRYSDNTHIEGNLNEIISLDNSNESKIECLGINANNQDNSKRIGIELCTVKGITFSINGNSNKWVESTYLSIENYLKKVKEWYSIFTIFSKFWFMIMIVMIYEFILIKIFDPLLEGKDNFTVFMFLFIIFIITSNLAIKTRRHLFPYIIFKIGDGDQRYNNLKKLRENIFWVIIISSIISLITGLIIYIITK